MDYDIVYKVICILLVIGSVYVGVRYVKSSSGTSEYDELVIKRNVVKKNRQIFGISDAEATEKKEVKTVKYEDLGINE